MKDIVIIYDSDGKRDEVVLSELIRAIAEEVIDVYFDHDTNTNNSKCKCGGKCSERK